MGQAALISIHSKHITNILSGRKIFEYRKILPKQKISHLAFYCTAPEKTIIAIAEVLYCMIDSPTKIWEKTSFGSGISRRSFRDYFSGRHRAIAFFLGGVYKLRNSVSISHFGDQKHPPRSFYYLKRSQKDFLMEQQENNPVTFSSLIFMGGIHGVGKSTMCKKTFCPLGYKCIPASSILHSSKMMTDSGKKVNNIVDNQRIILENLVFLKQKHYRLLLDGHYHFIDSRANIQPIDVDVFEKMRPSKLILLKGSPEEIVCRREKRDGVCLEVDHLTEFQIKEEKHARYISKKLGIPLLVVDNCTSPSKLAKMI